MQALVTISRATARPLPAAAPLSLVPVWEAAVAARRWADLALDGAVLGAEALALLWAAGMAYDAARLLLHG